jgi:hypothetical protein
MACRLGLMQPRAQIISKKIQEPKCLTQLYYTHRSSEKTAMRDLGSAPPDWIAQGQPAPPKPTAGRLPPLLLSPSLPGCLARGDSRGPSSTLPSRRLIYSPWPLPLSSAVVAATPSPSKMGDEGGELRRSPTREGGRHRGGACGKPVAAKVFHGGVD